MTATETSAEEKRILELGEKLAKDAAERADKRNNEAFEKQFKEFQDKLDAYAKGLQERFPVLSMPGVEKDATGKDKKKYSLARAAAGVATKDFSLCPYEHEVSRELAKTRAMSFGIDSGGGFLVPTEVMGGLIEKLEPQVIAFDLGVQTIEAGNVSPIVRNRQTGSATAEWVGEMASASKSQIKIGRMEVSPKAVSAKTDISNLLMLLGQGAAEQLIEREFAKRFARAFDRAILIGANSEIGPVGIANTIGVNTSTTASLDYDKVVDFEKELMLDDALMGRLGWALTPAQLVIIRKLKDTSGQPMQLRSIDGKGPGSIIGYPFRTSTQLGTTGANTVIFGDFSSATFYRWFGGMILKSTDTSDTAIDSNLTRVAGTMYGDVGVEQPTAFCVASA